MVKQLLSRLLRRQSPQQVRFAKDMDLEFRDIYRASKDYSMISMERAYGLYKATQYIATAGIPGDLVECGVWKGGSVMIMAHVLHTLGQTDRKIYLYDTFEGMPEPGDNDIKIRTGIPGKETWQEKRSSGGWAKAEIDEVKENIFSTPYPKDNFVFIKGKVEDTIPKTVPSQIALLRLDTDWYDSTYHELVHLYPLLSKNGVLIIDDYGSWAGARDATDQYFTEHDITPLLHRTDVARTMTKS